MDTADIPAPDTDRDTDAAMVTLVTTEEAAQLVGVSARTIRRWIQRGLLAATEGDRGQVVSPADLRAAKLAAGHGRGHGHGHGRTRPDTVTDADISNVTVSPAARSQLEAIRDEWLQPLVNQLRDAERSIGRLEQERDQLRAEVEHLTMRHPAPRPWWRFWER